MVSGDEHIYCSYIRFEPSEISFVLWVLVISTTIEENVIGMTTPAEGPTIPCSFCADTNAAVLITGQLVDKPLCLLHYYTTRAVRSFPTSRVTPIGNGRELQLQLPFVQSIFSEAFTELKHEISEEIAKQSLYHPSSLKTAHSFGQEAYQDPLSMLHSSSLFSLTANNVSGKRKLVRHRKEAEHSEHLSTGTEGGFIRPIKIPNRLNRNVNAETVDENSEIKIDSDNPSVNTCSSSKLSYNNPFQRKKSRNSSYWDTSGSSHQRPLKAKPGLKFCSSCGSSDFCVNKSNTVVVRGELLEDKGRSDMMNSFKCLNCGTIRFD